MTDCVIQSRIDPYVKGEAVILFEQMGLTLSEAIRLFVYQSVAEQRLPFAVKATPNAKTRAVLKKLEAGQGLEATSLEQLSKAWDRACVK